MAHNISTFTGNNRLQWLDKRPFTPALHGRWVHGTASLNVRIVCKSPAVIHGRAGWLQSARFIDCLVKLATMPKYILFRVTATDMGITGRSHRWSVWNMHMSMHAAGRTTLPP